MVLGQDKRGVHARCLTPRERRHFSVTTRKAVGLSGPHLIVTLPLPLRRLGAIAGSIDLQIVTIRRGLNFAEER
jgi:hypothetical protein